MENIIILNIISISINFVSPSFLNFLDHVSEAFDSCLNVRNIPYKKSFNIFNLSSKLPIEWKENFLHLTMLCNSCYVSISILLDVFSDLCNRDCGR